MAKETTPEKSRQILTAQDVRIRRHLRALGKEVQAGEDHVDPKTGIRTVYAEKYPDPVDNIRLKNHYASLGYEVSDEPENMRFRMRIPQEKFKANEAAAHRAHQDRVKREAAATGRQRGAFEGFTEELASISDTQVSEIDELFDANPDLLEGPG